MAGTMAQSAIAYMMATNDDAQMSDSGNSAQSNKAEAANNARKAFIDKFSEIVDDWIAHGQAVPPIIYVPIGTRFNVVLSQDLWLRSSEDDEQALNEEYGEQPTSAQRPDMPSWEENRKQQLNDMSDARPQNNNNAPATSTQPQESQAKQDAKNMATPIYDESDHMQTQDLGNRVVEPVTPTPPLF